METQKIIFQTIFTNYSQKRRCLKFVPIILGLNDLFFQFFFSFGVSCFLVLLDLFAFTFLLFLKIRWILFVFISFLAKNWFVGEMFDTFFVGTIVENCRKNDYLQLHTKKEYYQDDREQALLKSVNMENLCFNTLFKKRKNHFLTTSKIATKMQLSCSYNSNTVFLPIPFPLLKKRTNPKFKLLK